MGKRQEEWNSYVDEYVSCKDSPTPVCKDCKEKNGSIITVDVYKGRKLEKKVGTCCWKDGDLRGALDVAEAAKIALSGGPLYSCCANPACGKLWWEIIRRKGVGGGGGTPKTLV